MVQGFRDFVFSKAMSGVHRVEALVPGRIVWRCPDIVRDHLLVLSKEHLHLLCRL